MRIGLFGGTFNPIHYGHIRAALEVKEGFPLDECHFIPAATPPHKTIAGVADINDRLEMLQLALSEHSDFSVSDVELKRSGPSYSIDTVDYLKKIYPAGTELFLMVGVDAFLEFDTWKSYTELLAAIPIIVMARPTSRYDQTMDRWHTLENFFHSKISDEYSYSHEKACFSHPRLKSVYLFDVTLLDISSSKIRKLIRDGRSARFLLPETVEAYIRSRELYS